MDLFRRISKLNDDSLSAGNNASGFEPALTGVIIEALKREMRNNRASYFASLLAGTIIFAVAVFGLYNLTKRPGILKEYLSRAIVRVDDFEIRHRTDLRFVLTRKKIGDPVEIQFGPEEGAEAVKTAIVPYYSQSPFPLVYVLMGGFSFLAGFGVFLFKPDDRRARNFYWLSLSFGAIVIIGGSSCGIQGRMINILPGILFNIGFPMTLAALVWLARGYAPPRRRANRLIFWALPAAWSIFLCSAFLLSQLGPSIEIFRIRQESFHIFRIYIVAMGIAALAEFARAFRHAESDEDKTQIKWYLIGLAFGFGPFLLFYQIPLIFVDKPILSENFANIFFFLLPVFMAMAILQLRLLRVNIVFHRGLVYSLYTIFTLCAYLFSVEALKRLFPRAGAMGKALISVGAAFAIAFILSPGRRRIQDFVDKLFFRQAYEYRKALQDFKTAASTAIDAQNLVALFSGTLSSVLPLAKMGAVLFKKDGEPSGIQIIAGLNAETVRSLMRLSKTSHRPWAKADRIRGVKDLDFSGEEILASADLVIVMPVPPVAGAPEGFLAFGPKTSGHRFTREDIDFLEALAGDLAVSLGKIRLQEEIIYERASREKTEELARLKSEFISSVSHELRTPLTSLRGMSELLQSGKVADEARRGRLLRLMAGECSRLTRFISNVLDFGKIEKGAEAYNLKDTDLGFLIREVADLIRESHPEDDVSLEIVAPEESIIVAADADAVRQALLNLIDNGLKYSPGRKDVVVSLKVEADAVTIKVRDRGMGIAPCDLEKIFDPFFRSPMAVKIDPSGVGLGLKIVKHIMEGHGGWVTVESEVGKGTGFGLVFPIRGSG